MDATPTPAEPQPPAAEAQPNVCFRHPERENYVRCSRCDRNVCPDCRREASVGFHCVECLRTGQQGVRQARGTFGGRVGSGTPVVTVTLIVLNVLAYLLELARPAVVDRFDNLGQAMTGPDGSRFYIPDSGLVPPGFDLIGVAHGEWWRLITSAFLHAPPTGGAFGITHILFNMYWLWTLGRVIEERLGAVRYLTLYLVSALGGSVLGYLVAPEQASLGASGAIFGLAGGYYVLSRRLHHDPLGGSQLLVFFVVWMVVSASFTSWQGHLGGLLSGLAVGGVLAYAPRQQRALVQAIGVAAVLVLLVALTIAKTSSLALA